MCSTSRSFLQFPVVEEISRRRRKFMKRTLLFRVSMEEARKEQENERRGLCCSHQMVRSMGSLHVEGLRRVTFHSDVLSFAFAVLVWLCERVAQAAIAARSCAVFDVGLLELPQHAEHPLRSGMLPLETPLSMGDTQELFFEMAQKSLVVPWNAIASAWKQAGDTALLPCPLDSTRVDKGPGVVRRDALPENLVSWNDLLGGYMSKTKQPQPSMVGWTRNSSTVDGALLGCSNLIRLFRRARRFIELIYRL
ncbi:hypothetical protein B296_00001354 [Ensete ventricosum]|uniref:Uncharacterized protein n=1 Tax=Ensete ventricosum TaxID=4639 RepID=A0A426Z3J6_ENSVE|nr:hypothetical protein B296_00001354 [Ensete ventricosum]